jgi:hypothetical protein
MHAQLKIRNMEAYIIDTVINILKLVVRSYLIYYYSRFKNKMLKFRRRTADRVELIRATCHN